MAKDPKQRKKPGRKPGAVVPHPKKIHALHPETLEYIKNLSRMGNTQTKIAAILGISRNTLTLWKKESDPLRHALEKGRQEEFSEVVKVLSATAKSGKYPYLTMKYYEHLASQNDVAAQENTDQLNKDENSGKLGRVTVKELKQAIKKDVFIEVADTVEESIKEEVIATVVDQDVTVLDSPGEEIKDVTPTKVKDPFKD